MTSLAIPTSADRPDATEDSPVTQRSFADKAELAWIWWSVLYSVLRFVAAWGGFSEHGANPWIFGVVDVGTALPWAMSTAQVCRRSAAAQWRRLPGPLAIALVSFFAPYAYLWFAAGEMPAGLRTSLGVFIAIFFIAAVVGIVRKTRKLRREASEQGGATAVASTDASPTEVIDLRSPRAELLIDLTDEQPRIVRAKSVTD